MNPFGTRARADELAALLDGAVVSTGYDTSALLLVDRLRAAGTAFAEAATVRPEFRTALRGRLLAVAAVQGIGATAAQVPGVPAVTGARAVSWSVPAVRRPVRGLGVAAGAMASVVAVTGAAVASQRSLPGDPFYGAKKATEALQLRFADGELEKGTQHLEFAETRLREVRALALGRDQLEASGPFAPVASESAIVALGGSVGERVREALAAMDDETREGSELLDAAFRKSGEVEPLRVLSSFAKRQVRSLERVLPSLPNDARQRAQVSLALVTSVAQETDLRIELGTCGDACDPSGAGPTLPTASPVPAPSAVSGPQATEEPDCGCEPAPEPEPAPTPTAPEPAPSATAEPTPAPSPSQTPSPEPTSVLPTEVPVPLPLPSGLPTSVPLPPVVLPTALPTSLAVLPAS